MGIKQELYDHIGALAGRLPLPRIRRVYLPEAHPGPDRHTEFGVIELEDGAAGLYYAWLDASQRDMSRRHPEDRILGRDPMDIVPCFLSEHPADCSLGLAVINAVSQSFLRRAAYAPDPAPDSFGALEPGPDDHLGMVGYFPPLVERLGRRGIRMTVIEKQRDIGRGDARLSLTHDPRALRHCNKILATATVMLNDSVDEILHYSDHADVLVILGPTAGFLPDPLFRHGVTAVGGTEILDAAGVIRSLRHQQGLGTAARKYLIQAGSYPGLETLLRGLPG